MLLSCVFILWSKGEITSPEKFGEAICVWFLNLVRQTDPVLAKALGASVPPLPFTISPLQDLEQEKCPHTPSKGFWFRVTTLEERLSRCLLDKIRPNLSREIEIGGEIFCLEKVTCDPSEHPWAGQTTYEALFREHMLSAEKMNRLLALQFVSPTLFWNTDNPAGKEGQTFCVLSLPELIFGSYLEKWNAFAPVALPNEVTEYARKCMAINRFRLETRMAKGNLWGFTGFCQFRALVADPFWLRLLHLLAAFSFYAGTGDYTTFGMGQTKRV